MDTSKVAPITSTYTLEVSCLCTYGCKKPIEKVLQNADGVQSYKIDEDMMTVTISGNGNPHVIIETIHKKTHRKPKLMGEQKNKTTVPKALPVAEPKGPKLMGERKNTTTVPKALPVAEPKGPKLMGEQKNKTTVPQALPIAKAQVQKLVGPKLVGEQKNTTMVPQAQGSKVLSNISERIQPSHEHEYEEKKFQKRYSCNGCKEEGFGPRYRCKHCEYELHEECRFPRPKISHNFLKGSTLEFFDRLPSKNQSECCIACGRNIYGYVYHDKVKGWNLHPWCSNLKPKACNSNDSTETSILQKRASSECMWCKKKEVGGDPRIPGWSYKSSCGDEFHVRCMTEIMHEAWKLGRKDNIDCMDLKGRNDTKLSSKPKKKNGKSGKVVWKIVRVIVEITVGIVLGNPFEIFNVLPELF